MLWEPESFERGQETSDGVQRANGDTSGAKAYEFPSVSGSGRAGLCKTTERT